MSWSLAAIGKAPAVDAEIVKQAATTKCSEPEETVRQAAIAAIQAAVAAQDPTTVIKVIASGSQGKYRPNIFQSVATTPTSDNSTRLCNYLSITIEPQYGFGRVGAELPVPSEFRGRS